MYLYVPFFSFWLQHQVLDFFFVSAFGHFWPAVFSQGTLVAQLVYCKPVPARDHISKSFPWQVPESATQDDVAEEPVKSPEACEQLWTYLYPDIFWGL